MFGSKKTLPPVNKGADAKSSPEFKVQTMPDEFYGGSDPKVEFKEVRKEVDLDKLKEKSALRPQEKKAFEQKNAIGGNMTAHPANFLTSSKNLLILVGGLFILVVIVGAIYFVSTYDPSAEDKIVVKSSTSDVETSTISNTDIANISDITSTDSNTTVSSTASKELITYPSSLLGFGPDLDNDKLSDIEELVFGSDSSIANSDNDDYLDGHEVFFLYDPMAKEPSRIIDSDKIAEYVNESNYFKLYYPTAWTKGSIDLNYEDILFTSINGESVRVKVYKLGYADSFSTWFGQYAIGESYTDLQDITNVFQQKGKVRSDKLVYYFPTDNYVFVLVYQAGQSTSVNYLSVLEMMARSFRSSDNSYQKIWPVASSTPEIVSTTIPSVSVATTTFNDSQTTSTVEIDTINTSTTNEITSTYVDPGI